MSHLPGFHKSPFRWPSLSRFRSCYRYLVAMNHAKCTLYSMHIQYDPLPRPWAAMSLQASGARAWPQLPAHPLIQRKSHPLINLSEAASENWRQSVPIWTCGLLGTQGQLLQQPGHSGVSYSEDILPSPPLQSIGVQARSTFRGNGAPEQIRIWENADVLFQNCLV